MLCQRCALRWWHTWGHNHARSRHRSRRARKLRAVECGLPLACLRPTGRILLYLDTRRLRVERHFLLRGRQPVLLFGEHLVSDKFEVHLEPIPARNRRFGRPTLPSKRPLNPCNRAVIESTPTWSIAHDSEGIFRGVAEFSSASAALLPWRVGEAASLRSPPLLRGEERVLPHRFP